VNVATRYDAVPRCPVWVSCGARLSRRMSKIVSAATAGAGVRLPKEIPSMGITEICAMLKVR